MLFVLDDSIGSAMRQGNPAENIIIAVNTIALSYRRGLHLLTAGRDTLHTIIAFPRLDQPIRNIYKHLLENLPQMGGYRHFIRRIEITAQEGIRTIEERISELDGNRQRIIRLSARYIADEEITTKTKLLLENSSEHDFYRKIAETYLRLPKNQIGRITLNYEPDSGGGDGIAKEYQLTQSENRLCLCFVDSDRKYPGDIIGQTAKKMQAVRSSELCEFLILEVRMVENLIPLSLLQATSTYQQKNSVIDRLATISPEQRKYLHLRNGLKLKEFLEANDGFKAFWQGIVGEQPRCRKDSPCTNKDSCQCFIVEPLGKILDQVIAKLKGSVEFTVEDSLIYERERIGALIVAWCCSSPGIRA